jgi:hypothetical protein
VRVEGGEADVVRRVHGGVGQREALDAVDVHGARTHGRLRPAHEQQARRRRRSRARSGLRCAGARPAASGALWRAARGRRGSRRGFRPGRSKKSAGANEAARPHEQFWD